MMLRPPDELVRRVVPIMCKVVGIVFVVSGVIFLPVGCAILFMHGGDSKIVGAAFIVGSILQIAVGIVVVRFFPRFMLGIFERLR